ncbi:MAG: SusD/RagB family nutrient-binding outer membrane lipoprotein [Bacteroidetes bacterium 4572_77]|nr:MAG: SusD/RagB family nutrient-binding outer membrane lipoprotein [Bacteroidetes bacterium 4572_77]
MKKYIIYTIAILAFSSCVKLDIDPTQSIQADNAITNQADLDQALNGCYDAIQLSGAYGRNCILAPELSSDNSNATGTIIEYSNINENAMLSSNSIAENIWSHLYIAINRVNNALYYMPQIEDLSDTDRNNYKGQLFFIRSLAYFNLVRLYGDVPLKTSPSLNTTDINAPRTPKADIFNFIIADLTFASENITTTLSGKASKGSAIALLAKVYLLNSDWEKALLYATNAIDNFSYELVSDFASLYNLEDNSESIFEVKYDPQDKNRLAEYSLPTSLGGRYEVSPSNSLINAYSEDDIRKTSSFSGFDENPYCTKYSHIAQGDDRVYVLRLAEMYLLRAEANIRQTKPFEIINSDINIIRQRAQLNALNLTDYNELLTEVINQRQLEFAFEGHRWFDLLRNDLAIQMVATVDNSNQLLFPIPLSEIVTNDEIGSENQNPGY